MFEIGLSHYLFVAAALFTIGVFGIFVNRKNVIIILMSVELILLAVNINFVAFSAYLGDLVGQVFALFVLTVAAAEAALQRMFELGRSLSVTLKGRLVDDNRAGLTAASMDQIRQQLKDIHFAMNERGIAPGSVRALRLFS